jgi:uncharacterized protein (TIGR02145 family)
LYLPAAGFRYYSDGALYYRGYRGYYWSTRKYDTSNAYNMTFYSSSTTMNTNDRTFGYSVRCIVE